MGMLLYYPLLYGNEQSPGKTQEGRQCGRCNLKEHFRSGFRDLWVESMLTVCQAPVFHIPLLPGPKCQGGRILDLFPSGSVRVLLLTSDSMD